ncbi:hypothetical protein DYI37_02900 [Fulvimarina endophytica]|uniref:Uncharacterized protein n=1 Tax=Fulvimarina endophytica TaxID=2293836 RepID=A0A371XB01_9HYPH|nr:DUF6105 family protein [Fulvimarina endophytica]RFC66407.1 hypothetical protein DYI37_02900 [Fulvimarina endophytica]
MRKFFLFWVLPLGIFWSWFFAARADLGLVFFSRDVFDRSFAVYEAVLGLTADEVAWLIAKATVVDSLIILAIIAFRRRKTISAYLKARMAARRAIALSRREAGV